MAKINTYSFQVFYLTSIISSIPIIILAGMIPLTEWENIFWAFEYGNYFAVSIGIILLTPISKAKRSLAKVIENNIFADGKHFPTTEMLLWKNQVLSINYKKQIREKAEGLSGITLLSESNEDSNEEEARKAIRDIASHIRRYAEDVKFNKDANIAYGFSKNMAAGFIMSLPFSILCTVLFYIQDNLVGLCIVSAYIVISIIYLLFSKHFIKERANNYAQRLFEDFITKKEK